ncbi:MAG: NAD(P)H-dependent oxidoreductase [Gemmatimonadales bacterium]
MTLRLLAFAASLRLGSWNRKLLAVAVEIARADGAEVDFAEFREFDMPLYDADLQGTQGFPPGARLLGERILAVDGILLASPEYNFSLPGTLKNAIDWVSREKPTPLRGKSAMLLSTSTGLVGGNRGLWALRIPLESLGVHVYPDMFSLAQGDKAFDAAGQIIEPVVRERLAKMVHGYLRVATALAG